MRRIVAAVLTVAALALVGLGVLFVVGEATAGPETGEESSGLGYLFGGLAIALGLVVLVAAVLGWRRARPATWLGVAGFVVLVLFALLIGTSLSPWFALAALALLGAATALRLRHRLR